MDPGLTIMALTVVAQAGLSPLEVGEVKKVTNIETSYPFWSISATWTWAASAICAIRI